MPVPTPAVTPSARVRGVCEVLFVHDVGQSIDLDRAAALLRDSGVVKAGAPAAGAPVVGERAAGASTAGESGGDGAGVRRDRLLHQRRTPAWLQYRPEPLRVTLAMEPVVVAGFASAPEAEVALTDFGAACVAYRFAVEAELEALVPLAEALYENAALQDDARRRVRDVVRAAQSAIVAPGLADPVEDYAIWRLEPVGGGAGEGGAGDGAGSPERFVAAHGATLARLLRAEGAALSRTEIDDALACAIAYTPRDLALIDWNAALLLGDEADDAAAVLEFANIELLEMRYLDDRLDALLEEAYRAATRPRAGLAGWWPASMDRELRRIARLQLDAAVLFEQVNNTLKLVGDQHLARVYRLAAKRLHLPEWDASILRKLEMVSATYDRLSDTRSARRMEVLEWIIIVLIAVSTVIPLVQYAV